MKTKTIAVLFAGLFAAASLLGLAVPMGQSEAAEVSKDRLIGVLITANSRPFYHEPTAEELEELLLHGKQPEYDDRIYAVLKERTLAAEDGSTSTTKDFVFEGIDGISYYAASITDERGTYTSSSSSEGISEGHTAFKVTDEGEEISLKGTIYLSTRSGNEIDVFYTNPVYQTEDGAVYATAGRGISFSGDKTPGGSFNTKLEESVSRTLNDETFTDSTTVDITIDYMNPPERIVFLQMNKDGDVIGRTEYLPDEVPVELTPDTGTAYLIIETFSIGQYGDTAVTRALYEPDSDRADTYRCRQDGICLQQSTKLNWK